MGKKRGKSGQKAGKRRTKKQEKQKKNSIITLQKHKESVVICKGTRKKLQVQEKSTTFAGGIEKDKKDRRLDVKQKKDRRLET